MLLIVVIGAAILWLYARSNAGSGPSRYMPSAPLSTSSAASPVSELATSSAALPTAISSEQEESFPSTTSTFVGIEADAFFQEDVNMHTPTVELQLIDPQGRRLGYVASGTDAFEIPFGSYDRDDTGVDISDSLQAGDYQLKVIGQRLGTYVLSPIWYVPATGSGQSGWDEPIFGVSEAGSEDDYEVLVGTDPPSATVTEEATVSSTLQDIAASLKLGLLDDQDTAETLSSMWLSKVGGVSTSSAKIELLNLFRAQTAGKNVRGLAAQVLLRDADSLIQETQEN